MPKPFSSFFTSATATPDYGDDYSLIHPDFAPLILRVLAAHAGIDSARSMSFLCMFHSEARMAALTYSQLMLRGNLIAVMDATAEAYLSQEHLDFYRGVKRLTDQTNDARNALAHSHYMGSPAIGEAGILLMPARHWVLRSGEYIAQASTQQLSPLPQWDEPFNPAEMMVYSRDDLEEMRANMSRVQDAWLAFGKWVWPQICPIRFANPLAFLLAQEPIMETVNSRRRKRGEGPYNGGAESVLVARDSSDPSETNPTRI